MAASPARPAARSSRRLRRIALLFAHRHHDDLRGSRPARCRHVAGISWHVAPGRRHERDSPRDLQVARSRPLRTSPQGRDDQAHASSRCPVRFPDEGCAPLASVRRIRRLALDLGHKLWQVCMSQHLPNREVFAQVIPIMIDDPLEDDARRIDDSLAILWTIVARCSVVSVSRKGSTSSVTCCQAAHMSSFPCSYVEGKEKYWLLAPASGLFVRMQDKGDDDGLHDDTPA